MAGYFDYIGRIFTEKGSWYKTLTIVILQGLAMLFSPKAAFQQLGQGVMPDFNIPGILLYVLVSMLIFGFVMQIYNGAMNNKTQLLPDLDFMDMFIKSVKLIPFWIVWMLYIGIFGVLAALLMPTLARSGVVGVLLFILLAAFWIFVVLMMVVMLAIYSKNFSYKHVLNPLTPFRICPKLIGSVLGFMLFYVLLNIVLYGLLFVAAMLLGVAGGGETATDSMIAFGILITIWLYIYDTFSFAYNLKFADIVKEKLSGTKYLDGDFEVVPEVPENDEELDY